MQHPSAITTDRPLDLTAAIIAYETGELDHSDSLALFQSLVNTGLAWKLQGSYGRTAIELIESGYISPPPQSSAVYVEPEKRDRLMAELDAWSNLALDFASPENREAHGKETLVRIVGEGGEWEYAYGLCGAIRHRAASAIRSAMHKRMSDTLRADHVEPGQFGGYHWPLTDDGHDQRAEFCGRVAMAVRAELDKL